MNNLTSSVPDDAAFDHVMIMVSCGDMPDVTLWRKRVIAEGITDEQVRDGIIRVIEQKFTAPGERIGHYAERAGLLGLRLYPRDVGIERCLLKAQESYEVYAKLDGDSPGVNVSTLVHLHGSDEMIEEYNILVSQVKGLEGISTKWYTDPVEIGKLRPRYKRSDAVEGRIQPGLASSLGNHGESSMLIRGMDSWVVVTMLLIFGIGCAGLIRLRLMKKRAV